MKYSILFIFVLLSCSKDDKDCKCDLKVTETGENFYYVTNVPTDCNGNYDRPDNVPDNHFIVGTVNCDE